MIQLFFSCKNANLCIILLQGFCMMPDTCICKDGWTGPNCTECVPYWNCQHGTCQKPWECNCDAGYFGLECNDTKTIGKYFFQLCNSKNEFHSQEHFNVATD